MATTAKTTANPEYYEYGRSFLRGHELADGSVAVRVRWLSGATCDAPLCHLSVRGGR